ncbi:MAG: hypothetical protein ACI8XO_003363 [Verrucomicrobiales bacterium]|jgi:hypothetical protein
MQIFEKKTPDPRVIATKTICRGAVVMIALCIPMVVFLKDPLLPFLVIGGAALGISSVWFFGRSKVVVTHSKEIDVLEKAVEAMQERLEGMEVRNRFEETLAEKELGAASDDSSGRVMGKSID